MKQLTKLEDIFKHVSSIDLDKYVLFDDLELYNKETEESKYYKDYSEVYNDEEIITQINEIKFTLQGGRGASSSRKGGKMFGGKNKPVKMTPLHPAHLNTQGRKVSVEGVIQNFIKKHGKSDREFSTAVDSQGFAHTYTRGGKNTVAIPDIKRKFTAVHNHPSGSNFSGTDLRTFSSMKNMTSIVATNDKKAYRLTKKHNFDAKGFEKAVNKAKMSGSDYNKSVDRWLKRNAKKYGYTYEYK